MAQTSSSTIHFTSTSLGPILAPRSEDLHNRFRTISRMSSSVSPNRFMYLGEFLTTAWMTWPIFSLSMSAA